LLLKQERKQMMPTKKAWGVPQLGYPNVFGKWMEQRVVVKDGVSQQQPARMVYIGCLKKGRNYIRWVITADMQVLAQCCLTVVGHSELGWVEASLCLLDVVNMQGSLLHYP
jgi:hypothetical protein